MFIVQREGGDSLGAEKQLPCDVWSLKLLPCSRHRCLLQPSGAEQLTFYLAVCHLELGGAAREQVWGAGLPPAGSLCSVEL